MKANAERASDAPTSSNPVGGGAHYVASRLKTFCDAHQGRLELHAVGHSAGSVFHAHFLPLARQLGVPRFKSAQFMAPAVRVDIFKDQLLPLIGTGDTHAVETLTMSTMRREFERRDHCARVYGKSLLYLIHHALEPDTGTPFLGLEDSLRTDSQMKAAFGLAGATSSSGEVVWSPTSGDSGRSASRATAHGDFDDDAPTMNSLARRVLGKADADAIINYPAVRSRSTALSDWLEEIDWPEPLRLAMTNLPAAAQLIPQPPSPPGVAAAIMSPPAVTQSAPRRIR